MPNVLSKLLEPTTNGPEATQLLTTLLDVKISATTLKKELEEHPDYPSLLSISDVLNSYGIENIGIKLDPGKFANIPCPFITQLKGIKSSVNFFTVVKALGNNGVTFFDPEKHVWAVAIKDDFLKRCSGIALLTEVGDNAGEKDYAKKISEEKRKRVIQYLTISCIPILAIISAIFSLQLNGTSLLSCIFMLLTLFGSGVGILLVWYELDQHNPVLQQICSVGKKISCSAVLQSKASKIAGISWSVIGFSYFTGLVLLQLFGGINAPLVLYTIAWINAFAVPYVVFSIYYQWRIAKQWCVLCLLVQALLVLQMAVGITGGWYNLLPVNAIPPAWIIQTLTVFIIPFIVTGILIPALQKAKESKHNYTELQKLKHNRQIFEALLQKQKEVTQNPEGLGITLGNPNASYKLIKVCNPYCGPCAKAHKPMEDLLDNNPDVQIQVLFTATNREGDKRTLPVKHLLSIAEKSNEDTIKHALDDWYLADVKNYETFASKYPMGEKLDQQNTKIDAMSTWCSEVKIKFTPTFFVAIHGNNGQAPEYHQLPEIYNVNDLKYFFSV